MKGTSFRAYRFSVSSFTLLTGMPCAKKQRSSRHSSCISLLQTCVADSLCFQRQSVILSPIASSGVLLRTMVSVSPATASRSLCDTGLIRTVLAQFLLFPRSYQGRDGINPSPKQYLQLDAVRGLCHMTLPTNDTNCK